MAAPCPPFSDTANLQTSAKQTAPLLTLTLAAPRAHPQAPHSYPRRSSRSPSPLPQDHVQQLETLITNRAPLALIDPLATPDFLRIADADDKTPLWLAIEHHGDEEVIKLLISRHPPALVAVVGGEDIWEWFQSLMPAENRFSDYTSWDAFKELRFLCLIELCGTSDALEALVAAYVPWRTTCRCTCSASAMRGTRCSRASNSSLPRLRSTSSSTRTSLVAPRLVERQWRQWRCWRACWPCWTPRRGTSWTPPTLQEADVLLTSNLSLSRM